MLSRRTAGGLLAFALLATGCDSVLLDIAAGSTIRVVSRASPAIQRYADIELAEVGIPASMATLEGVLIIKPESEVLHATLARSYASFGFGFLEDHMEQALAEDNEVRAEHYRARATAAFMRSRQLAFEQMDQWEPDDGGVLGHVQRGVEPFRTYLATFDDQEQGGILFWGAYSWARYIGLHRDDVNAIADLPFVVLMAERAKALDHEFNYFAPHALVAGLMGSTPAQLGGRPQEAKTELEAAIAATHRHNLMYLTLEARIIAVALQDRGLYRRLLQEVIDAGDVDPSNRLANQIAKRRAFRYLADIENQFPPEENPAPAPAAAAE